MESSILGLELYDLDLNWSSGLEQPGVGFVFKVFRLAHISDKTGIFFLTHSVVVDHWLDMSCPCDLFSVIDCGFTV